MNIPFNEFTFYIGEQLKFKGILQISKCIESNCTTLVSIGLPYCKIHLQQKLNVTIKETNKGNSVFSIQNDNIKIDNIIFKKDLVMFIYDGEQMSIDEVNKRYGINNTAPYVVHSLVKTINLEALYIDSSLFRSIGSLINCSDNQNKANLKLQNIGENVYFVTINDIYNDEELLFDYGASYKMNQNGIKFSTKKITEEKIINDYFTNERLKTLFKMNIKNNNIEQLNYTNLKKYVIIMNSNMSNSKKHYTHSGKDNKSNKKNKQTNSSCASSLSYDNTNIKQCDNIKSNNNVKNLNNEEIHDNYNIDYNNEINSKLLINTKHINNNNGTIININNQKCTNIDMSYCNNKYYNVNKTFDELISNEINNIQTLNEYKHNKNINSNHNNIDINDDNDYKNKLYSSCSSSYKPNNDKINIKVNEHENQINEKQQQLTLKKNTLHNYYKTNINNKKENNYLIKNNKQSLYKKNDDFNYTNNKNIKQNRKLLHSKNNDTEIIDLTLTEEIIINNSNNSIINLLSDDENN